MAPNDYSPHPKVKLRWFGILLICVLFLTMILLPVVVLYMGFVDEPWPNNIFLLLFFPTLSFAMAYALAIDTILFHVDFINKKVCFFYLLLFRNKCFYFDEVEKFSIERSPTLRGLYSKLWFSGLQMERKSRLQIF